MNPRKKIIDALYIGDNNLLLLNHRYLPRWAVLVIDIFLCFVAFCFMYLFLQTTPIKFITQISLIQQVVIFGAVNVIFFYLFKTYSGIIRHSTFIDITKLAFSAFATATSLILINQIVFVISEKRVFITTSILLYGLISFCLHLIFRMFIKETYNYLKNNKRGLLKERVVVIGVDDQTISFGKALITESNSPFELVGFFTENKLSKRLKLLDKPVFLIKNDFKELLFKNEIDAILFVGDSVNTKEKNTLVEICLKSKKKIYNVPSLEQWNSREDIQQKIKPIQIEDLLERNIIDIDSKLIETYLQGKTILITGGAGSIGSEIVKQVAEFNPKLVIILDQAESPLHDLELYLMQNFENLNFETKLANISNMYRMEMLFDTYDFDVVYHAAAYKHVPLIERNPHEGIFVNILGTVNLAVLSVSHKIERFVMVSTDKAVNPTNVMGASKRAAEMYVQSLQYKNALEDSFTTKFITTRFGNVLGSNGSVIPYFRKQIADGGPVTVTHKDIIRYFMTIPEACQLVLQAGTMGKGGEIFIFDMGKPVKILNLAKRMIKLSGFEPYRDIDIKITGLRPGEKLYEELLNDKSTTLPTHHPKIMISKEQAKDFEMVNGKIKQIIKYAARFDDEKVVKELKELIPEFISNNSLFEKLDNN